jgi:hypothetical protein
MTGFQVITYGRVRVIAEVQNQGTPSQPPVCRYLAAVAAVLDFRLCGTPLASELHTTRDSRTV